MCNTNAILNVEESFCNISDTEKPFGYYFESPNF